MPPSLRTLDYGARSNDWYWALEHSGDASWGVNFDDGFTGFDSGSTAFE